MFASLTTTPSSATPALRFAPPGRYTSACASCLADVPAAQWDGLVGPGSAALSHGVLSAWEQATLRGLRSRPVLAHSAARQPVGACPGYFYDLDIATVRFPQSAPVVSSLRRALPELLYVQTYELGNPTPLTSPFLVADGEREAAVISSLIDAGVQEGERGGAAVMLVQNFTSTDCPTGYRLAEHGFAAVGAPSTAVVDIPYASFDEYLGAMRAQYRRRAKRALKQSQSLIVERREHFDDLADELAALWKSIYDRAHEVKREVLTAAYFRAVSDAETTRVLLLRRADGTIASFALLISDPPWLAFVQCGFEPAAREEAAYFRLLYEIIRFGIEHRYEQVDLGITTLAPKLDVGAVPVPLIAWLRHRNPLIQRVILALARGPLRVPHVDPRRVFKKAPPAASELVAKRGLPC